MNENANIKGKREKLCKKNTKIIVNSSTVIVFVHYCSSHKNDMTNMF